jgi:iron complex outermembrane recepter protein
MQNQIPLACGSAYTTNVGAAVSDGFDLGLRAALGDSLRLGLAVGYADAHYARTIVTDGAVRASSGDAVGSLPLVPAPWNVSALVDYQAVVGSGLTLGARAEDVYHSHNPGPFYSQDPASLSYDPSKRSDPAYRVLNLQASLRSTRLELTLAVDNALDAQPTLLLRNAYPRSTFFYATTLRPRTTRLAVNWHY